MKGCFSCIASVTGDFAEFDMTPKRMLDVLNALSEFELIPQVVNEMNIDQQAEGPPKVISVSRFQGGSPTKGLGVGIWNNNITIEANPLKKLEEEMCSVDIQNFVEDATKIAEILLSLIGKNGSRIALIIGSIIDSENLNYDKLAKRPQIFDGEDIFEWSTRTVFRKNIEINGNEERINVVTKIYKTMDVMRLSAPDGKELDLNGPAFSIDINTIPEETGERIDGAFIKEFYKLSLDEFVRIHGGLRDVFE